MDQNKDDIRQIPKVGKSAQISAFGTLKECLTGKADKGESSGNSTSSAEPFCESADGYTSEASQSDCRISRQASPEQHDEVDLVQKPAAGASLLGAPPGLEEVVGNSPATIPSTSGKVPTCSTADSDAACGMNGWQSNYFSSAYPWSWTALGACSKGPWPEMGSRAASTRTTTCTDKNDSLSALRTVIQELTADLPPECVFMAENLLASAARENPPNVQRTMEGIQALRWLKFELERQRLDCLNSVTQALQVQHYGADMSSLDEGFYGVGWDSTSGLQAAWLHLMACCQFPNDFSNDFANDFPNDLAAQWDLGMGSCLATGWDEMWSARSATWDKGGQTETRDRNQARLATKNATATHTSKGNANSQLTNEVSREPDGKEATLRAHLRDLQNVESDRIILIRKVNRLGFEAPKILEAHFAQYGTVERVLVASSIVKAQHHRHPARTRPSGLGFMVMSKAEDAQVILKQGEEQTVQGIQICVRHFERRSANSEAEVEEGGSEEHTSTQPQADSKFQ